MATYAMLDLETLSLKPKAVILQIGVVLFNETRVLPDFLNITLDTTSQIFRGRHVDPETVKWWNTQVRPTLNKPVLPLKALNSVNAFLANNSVTQVWANSPAADCIWMKSLADDYGVSYGWTHKSERDVRTLKNLVSDYRGYDYQYKRTTVHDAVQDARDQAEMVIELLGQLAA